MLEFEERTIKVTIDTDKCSGCDTKACIAACSKYDRGTLKEKDGKPSVDHLSPDDIKRLGTECLACEYECMMRGKGAIKIDVPLAGLDEYLKKRGLS